jgi:ParB-like chromosome segregation protein Spo0J
MAELKRIPVERIVVSVHRYRREENPLYPQLKASIEQIGLRTPLTVYPIGRFDMYELIAGVERLKACEELGHTEVACMIVTKEEAQSLIDWRSEK